MSDQYYAKAEVAELGALVGKTIAGVSASGEDLYLEFFDGSATTLTIRHGGPQSGGTVWIVPRPSQVQS